MTPDQKIIYDITGLASGLCWTIAYGLIIRRGFKDGAHGMPLVPLCVNISYEVVFGFIHPDIPPTRYVNQIWAVVDALIVYQYLRHGRKELPASLPRSWFVPSFLLVLATAFAGVLAVTYEFGDWNGNYSGWGDQLLLSASFISLLLRRNSVRGQSVYITLARMMGTLLVVPAQYLLTPASKLLAFIYVAFFVFDLIYLFLLLRQHRAEGLNPWRRA